MVESIIKILNRIKNNIKRYQVKYTEWFTSLGVRFIYNSKEYYIQYSSGKQLTYYIKDIGTTITTSSVDEISKHELLKLFAIVKRNCEDYTSTQMRDFADSLDDEEID